MALLLAALWQGRRMDVEGMQGAGWAGNDAWPAIAQTLCQAEPRGAVLAGDAGGLHWLGEWYLGRPWRFFESPEEARLAGLKARTGEPLYWLSGRPPGRSEPGWKALPAPPGWSLQRWEGEAP